MKKGIPYPLKGLKPFKKGESNMKVSEIMKTEVYSVKPDDKLTQIAAIICRKKVSGVCVLDDDGKLAGIVSEKDLLKAMYPTYAEFNSDPMNN
ncbi:MAG: HPP family protein, partial [Nitrospinota bacterium]